MSESLKAPKEIFAEPAETQQERMLELAKEMEGEVFKFTGLDAGFKKKCSEQESQRT